ncbi:MAG: hypothetical protein WAN35_00580 [Terracidiphilus sp.]
MGGVEIDLEGVQAGSLGCLSEVSGGLLTEKMAFWKPGRVMTRTKAITAVPGATTRG